MIKEILSMIKNNEDESTRLIPNHFLYHYSSCPFCFRVSISMKKLGIGMEKRNIHQGSEHINALKEGGGSTMVPCLRIDNDGETKWLYESADIERYLNDNFSSSN